MITFIWIWIFLLPGIISPTGVYNPIFYALGVVGSFGPMLAAIILTYNDERKQGIKNLLKRVWNQKFEKKWLVVSFFLFPGMLGLSFLLSIITEMNVPYLQWFGEPWLPFLVLLFNMLAIGEEFGFRGYMLDKFQVKWSALDSSLILGAIWGFWHFPAFFIAGFRYDGFSFLLFLGQTMIGSILYTWLYNNTNRSILTVTILHATSNLTIDILFPLQSMVGYIYAAIILIVTVIIVVTIFGEQKLVRN